MPPKEAPQQGDQSSSTPVPPTPPTRPPPSNESTPPPEPADPEHLARLAALESMLKNALNASQITNPSFEIGRPSLKPIAAMRGDPTDIYNRPSTDFLWNLKPKKISNNVATSEDMIKIKVQLEGMGVPSEHVVGVIMQLAICCKDTSSSSYQDPHGTFEWPHGAIMVDDVVGVVNGVTTLRKVCRFYAAVVWNYMHIHNCPPSDWDALGFKRETRYAAFDFFDYVENPAVLQPQGGVVPRPSPAEKLAYQTYKRLALDRANNNETYTNYSDEITGGRTGPEIIRNRNNANNKRQ